MWQDFCIPNLSEYFNWNDVHCSIDWTGKAALLLDGGMTLHWLFGIPVLVLIFSVSSIKSTPERAAILREVSDFQTDDAAIIAAAAIDCMDCLL